MKSPTSSQTFSAASSLALRLTALAVAVGLLVLATLGWMSHNARVTATYRSGLSVEERRALFQKALALNPAEGWAWWQLAKIELSRRNLRGAQEAAERAIATFPRYMAYPLLAQILYTRSVTDASARHPALEAFDTALAINPGDWVLLNQAARVALWNHDAPRARRYLEQADYFQINPRDPRAQNVETLLLRTELAEVEGNYDEARRLAERTLLLSPRSAAATLLLARLLSEHFGDAERGYQVLRDRWEAGLTPDYVRLMSQWATEREDIEAVFRVIDDLLDRLADAPVAEGGVDEVLQSTVADAAEKSLPGVQRQAFLSALHSQVTQRLAGNPSDAEIEMMATHLIRPVWDVARERSDQEAMTAVLNALNACAAGLDAANETVRSLMSTVSEAVRGAS